MIEISHLDVHVDAPAAQKRYERFFGSRNANSGNCYEFVKKNITAMTMRILHSPLYLYNRTKTAAPSASGSKTDWPFMALPSPAVKMEIFGATIRQKDRTLALTDPGTDTDAVHIILGANVDDVQNRVQAITETIIHEMSHYVCDARDVKLIDSGNLLEKASKKPMPYAEYKRIKDDSNDPGHQGLQGKNWARLYGRERCEEKIGRASCRERV